MKNNLKLLIPFAIVALTFSVSQVAQGMEDLLQDEEQQSIKIHQQSIKIQEAEQKEKQEKISFWSAGIDQNVQHVKNLQSDNLTYSELLKVLKDMQLYYTKEEASRTEAVLSKMNDQEIRSLTGCLCMKKTWEYGGAGWHYIEELQTRARSKALSMDDVSTMHKTPWKTSYCELPAEVKEIVTKKMENYEKLQGSKHPLWDEFSKM